MACWLKDHPVIRQIKSHSDSLQSSAAAQVYFDLTEVKQWHHVRVHASQCSQLVYLTAKQCPTSQGETLIVIPLPADTQITMNMISELFQQDFLQAQECSVGVASQDRLTLGLVDSEGSITYHNIYKGFHPPIPM